MVSFLVGIQSILSVILPDLLLERLKAIEAPKIRGFVLPLAVPRKKDLKMQIAWNFRKRSGRL